MLVIWPTNASIQATTLKEALAALGHDAELRVQDPGLARTRAVAEAADLWLPRPDSQAADLIIACGTRPWAEHFEGEHWVELEAMQRREALITKGVKLIFVDWPRGARRDAEVDLSAEVMQMIYKRAMEVDYDELKRMNSALKALLQKSEEVRLTCPSGTDLTFSVRERPWHTEDCVLSSDEPAVYLPGGEVYVAVRENSAQGIVAFRHVGMPRWATLVDGLLVQVTDEKGQRDRELEEELGCGVEPLCEFGVGTNLWAPPWQIGTLYEKSAGTVHVAVGGNEHFGGQRSSPRHMDLIVRSPTVAIDGVTIDLPTAEWTQFAPRTPSQRRV